MVDFLFPPLCLGCGEYTESPDSICDNCLKAMDCYDYPLCLTCGGMVAETNYCPVCRDDSFLLFAYANYRDPLKEIVIQFKFKGITSPAAWGARMLSDRFGDRIRDLSADCFVPIPLYPSREYSRGYNQAMLLAEELSRRLSVPVDKETLLRVKRRRPQALLSSPMRIANIRGAFAVDEESSCDRTVLLVDDVVTSGATVREARRELMSAGFSVPAVISIAHGL